MAKAVKASAAGANTLTVDNSNLFAPGTWFMTFPAAGGSPGYTPSLYQVTASVGGLLTFSPLLTVAVALGDSVVGVPVYFLGGQPPLAALSVAIDTGILASGAAATVIAGPGGSLTFHMRKLVVAQATNIAIGAWWEAQGSASGTSIGHINSPLANPLSLDFDETSMPSAVDGLAIKNSTGASGRLVGQASFRNF